MNNAEIRKRALAKAKGKIPSFTLMLAAAYILMHANAFILVIPFLAIAFIFLRILCVGGRAFVAYDAWHNSRACWGGFATCFKNRAAFTAGLAVEAVIAAAYMALILVMNAVSSEVVFVIGLILLIKLTLFCAVVEPAVYYAAAENPGYSAKELLKNGLSAAFGNFWRILCMQVNLCWWLVLLAALVFVFMALALKSANMLLNLGVSAGVTFVLYWAVCPYIAMAQAGLATEIFKNRARK